MIINEDLTINKEEFSSKLPELMGDEYYNDPETKQQPTKMFDNIGDLPSLLKMTATAQRKSTQNEAKYAEKYKGMVKIPDEKSKPEEVIAYRKAIGVPEKMEEYGLAVPENIDAVDKPIYETIIGVIKPAAHIAGVPKKVLSDIWGKVASALKKQDDIVIRKGEELEQKDQQMLKDKHKEKYPEFIKAGNDARAKFTTGKAFEELLKMHAIDDYPQVREFLAEIAPLVLEGKTVAGAGEGTAQVGDGWPLTYKYDPVTGKPL